MATCTPLSLIVHEGRRSDLSQNWTRNHKLSKIPRQKKEMSNEILEATNRIISKNGHACSVSDEMTFTGIEIDEMLSNY